MTKGNRREVYILKRFHNDYDQHGAYFEAVFDGIPTLERLAKYFIRHEYTGFADSMEALAFIEHLRNGGGRQDIEDVWYTLEKVECL